MNMNGEDGEHILSRIVMVLDFFGNATLLELCLRIFHHG